MEIIKMLLGPMLLFFPVRRLAQQLQNASLAVLRSNSVLTQISELEWPGVSEKQAKMIDDLWLKRVLLLVTGVDDVLAVLDKLEDKLEGDLYYQLIEGYGKQVKSIDSIILLLNRLWEHADMASKILKALNADTESMMLKVLDTEFVLAKRAKELSATSPANHYTLGNLEAMAEKIIDAVGDGSGSKTSEDIVIALALPKLKSDFEGGMRLAKSFKELTGRYRFLQAFVAHNGISNSHQVVRLIDELITTSQFGGKELAITVLEAVKTAGIKISELSREKLEAISDGRMGRFIELQGLSDDSEFDQDLSSDGEFDIEEMLKVVALLKALSIDFNPGINRSSELAEIHALFKGRTHPQAEFRWPLVMKNVFAQFEKHLLRHVEQGRIKDVYINKMPVGTFLEKNPELVGPEVRATIQAALAQ